MTSFYNNKKYFYSKLFNISKSYYIYAIVENNNKFIFKLRIDDSKRNMTQEWK